MRRGDLFSNDVTMLVGLNAIAGGPQQFNRTVPDEYLTRVRDWYKVACTCGRTVAVRKGRIKSCPCGRFFVGLRGTVKVAHPPAVVD